MIRVTFADTASRDAFAERIKSNSKVGDTQLDIGWHFLQFAKLDTKALDYDEIELLKADGTEQKEHEFLVKGDPKIFGEYATIIEDMGGGFYHVSSPDGLVLGDYVESIEHNSAPIKFLDVSTVNSMGGTDAAIDPTSADAQWARIRIASRYRPFATQFLKHDTNYQSTPELIIMDSGINPHTEFDYPGLTIENFYTLPTFNGSYIDDVGHGTAVTAMAVGKNLGIASRAKVLNCKIGGLDYTANLKDLGMAIDAIVARASADPLVTRVVNMSWGIARSAWLDAKVQSLLDMGITVVCAAGNQGISVEDISPAGLDTVITVGSIDKYDIPSGFNNISPSDAGLTTGHGLSLDIFAPGENVYIAKNVDNAYKLASGTSFAAPLISGIAVEVAALYENMVPYAQLKNIILDTATENTLLFEDDKFSENQNRVGYLITADSQVNLKTNNQSMYLGVHQTEDPIIADLRSAMALDIETAFPDEPVNWSLEWVDPDVEKDYAQFMELDAVTGLLTINAPTVPLPPETSLKMIEFVAVAKTSKITMKTPLIFYFASNPDHKDTLSTDVTLALTDTNTISFYAAWGAPIK